MWSSLESYAMFSANVEDIHDLESDFTKFVSPVLDDTFSWKFPLPVTIDSGFLAGTCEATSIFELLFDKCHTLLILVRGILFCDHFHNDSDLFSIHSAQPPHVSVQKGVFSGGIILSMLLTVFHNYIKY